MAEHEGRQKRARVEVLPGPRGNPSPGGSSEATADGPSELVDSDPISSAAMRPTISDRLYLGWHLQLLIQEPTGLPPRPAKPQVIGPDEHAIAERERQTRADLQAWTIFGILAAVTTVVGIIVAAVGAASTGAIIGSLVLAVCAGAAFVATHRVRSSRWSAFDEWRRAQQAHLDALNARAQQQYKQENERHNSHIDAYLRQKRRVENQTQWWAVAGPTNLTRVDVLGGVPQGWSAERGAPSGWDALLTTFCGTRVEVGAEVTVLDLTGSAIAQTSLDLFEAAGVARAAYVLPRELPLVHLGAGLSKELLHEILSNVVHIAEETGTLDGWTQDAEILRRVIDCFPITPTVAQVLAGLRLLAQVGDVRDDLNNGLLTVAVLHKLNALYGERAVQAGLGERLLKVVTHLQPLATLSSTPTYPRNVPLKVYGLDRRAPAVTNEMLRAFLISAFTALINQVTPRQPWNRSIVVCGAERVAMSALLRLMDACAAANVGLMLMYQTADESHQKIIGRGNAAVAFMRLGTYPDAKFASEFLGTEYQFVLSQITETTGESITDTTGDSYSKTVGTSETMGENWGTSSSQGFSSTSQGFSRSLTFSESTTWGKNTSRAVGQNTSAGRTLQRSRENLVEPHELQALPPTAFIYARSDGAQRTALLGDANPLIATNPKATALTVDDGQLLYRRCGWLPNHV